MGSRSAHLRPSPTKASPGIDDLVEAIVAGRLILFVGGGVSQNLGLPDFATLVRHIEKEMGFAPKSESVAEYAVVAEAYLLKHGRLGPLRSWMDATWHPTDIDISKSEIHNIILDLNFPIIYTTNYDRWLEIAFEKRRRPFHKIANIADLAVDAAGRTEIIKFHGDFQDDDSLVLTEASYFQRMIFESPLDIRLRSDCLARPLLFLGYSLHDINTRYLFYRLQELWKNSPHADQRPLSYILMIESDPAQEMVLEGRGIHPIVLESNDPGGITLEFLRELSAAVASRRKGNRSSQRRRRNPD
ncbi:MAG: SIR2 family protein [Acidobacteriaceae bacterium]